MSYKLFIDDERFPPSGVEMVIVRNYKEAVETMNRLGCPEFISFDHDLGDEYDGVDIVNWLIGKDLDTTGGFIRQKFTYYVHSQNPVGRDNIQGILESYLKFRAQKQ